MAEATVDFLDLCLQDLPTEVAVKTASLDGGREAVWIVLHERESP